MRTKSVLNTEMVEFKQGLCEPTVCPDIYTQCPSIGLRRWP